MNRIQGVVKIQIKYRVEDDSPGIPATQLRSKHMQPHYSLMRSGLNPLQWKRVGEIFFSWGRLLGTEWCGKGRVSDDFYNQHGVEERGQDGRILKVKKGIGGRQLGRWGRHL